MLIAEDLLLLLTDDTTGRFVVDGTALDLALAGAVLLELAEKGRITITTAADVDMRRKGKKVKAGRVKVVTPLLTGDGTLDQALDRCGELAGKKPEAALGALAKGLRPQLLDRLAHAGILRADHGRVLGVFPSTRWPAADSAHESQLHDQLRSVLVHGITPDPRTAALAALLSAVDAPHKVLASAAGGAGDIDKKAVRARAKEIREGSWAVDAVGKAIEAVQAAITTALYAAIAVSAGAAAGSAG